jgi:hypothetical protein
VAGIVPISVPLHAQLLPEVHSLGGMDAVRAVKRAAADMGVAVVDLPPRVRDRLAAAMHIADDRRRRRRKRRRREE